MIGTSLVGIWNSCEQLLLLGIVGSVGYLTNQPQMEAFAYSISVNILIPHYRLTISSHNSHWVRYALGIEIGQIWMVVSHCKFAEIMAHSGRSSTIEQSGRISLIFRGSVLLCNKSYISAKTVVTFCRFYFCECICRGLTDASKKQNGKLSKHPSQGLLHF